MNVHGTEAGQKIAQLLCEASTAVERHARITNKDYEECAAKCKAAGELCKAALVMRANGVTEVESEQIDPGPPNFTRDGQPVAPTPEPTPEPTFDLPTLGCEVIDVEVVEPEPTEPEFRQLLEKLEQSGLQEDRYCLADWKRYGKAWDAAWKKDPAATMRTLRARMDAVPFVWDAPTAEEMEVVG